MCYDDNARPPLPPDPPGETHTEDIVLTARDGAQLSAFIATPTGSVNPGAQVIIYPDVRGMHGFYKDLALRFAQSGITAIAFDYFGRTAGLTARDDSFEYMPHVQQLKLDSLFMDIHAALDYLRDNSDANAPIFVVGFCIGGTITLLSGADPSFGFAGLIPFYAGMTRNFDGKGTVLDNAERVIYPVLGLFGGADAGIPESAVHELDAKLATAKVDHEMVIYPGAPHSFFDRKAVDFADASADSWRRILAFIKTHQVPG